jgi:sec-independent protein translocase protein TatA
LLLAVVFVSSGCGVGTTELIVILAIVLILFGATRLPQLGKALGETIKGFKQGSQSDGELPEKNDAELANKKKDRIKIEEAKTEDKKEV